MQAYPKKKALACPGRRIRVYPPPKKNSRVLVYPYTHKAHVCSGVRPERFSTSTHMRCRRHASVTMNKGPSTPLSSRGGGASSRGSSRVCTRSGPLPSREPSTDQTYLPHYTSSDSTLDPAVLLPLEEPLHTALPMEPAPAPVPMSTTLLSPLPPTPPPPYLQVFVVDDNAVNRLVLKRLVEVMLVAEVSGFEDGPSALAAIRTRHPPSAERATGRAVLLTDIHMEPMSGLELAKALRESYEACDLPIIGVFVCGS